MGTKSRSLTIPTRVTETASTGKKSHLSCSYVIGLTCPQANVGAEGGINERLSCYLTPRHQNVTILQLRSHSQCVNIR